MKILIDMNLSPGWCELLKSHDYEAVHWSTIGDPSAADAALFNWARDNGYIVFTHDLDFGTLLALSQARGPSVLQVRTQRVLPEDIGALVIEALKQCAQELDLGALVVIDEARLRTRMLPISRRGEE